MKRNVLLLIILMAVTAGSLYGQEEADAKNIIGLSVGFIGAEISYERVFSPYFSVLGQVSYSTWVFADSLSVLGKARWYPFGGAFFLDLGIGYSNGYNLTDEIVEIFADILLGMISFGLWFLSDEYQSRDHLLGVERENSLLVQSGLGWNIDIGKKNHFMLPVSLGMDIRILKNPVFLPYLRLGLSYAF